MTVREVALGLLRSSHPLPTVAVTLLTAGLVASAGGTWSHGLLVVAAVFTGQLVIGWSNDLIDAERDRVVGRVDKPVARGDVGATTVRAALAAAGTTTVVLSILLPLPAAGLHLGLCVGSGLAYNLWLKGSAASWLPYAVAFGAYPAVAWLGVGAGAPPWWAVAVGALLGVGAHLLNVLPDLADDERTGVRGLPHRLGEARTRFFAPLLLLAGAVLIAFAPDGAPSPWSVAVLLASVGLAAVAWKARGKTPFGAAVALAVVTVVALVIGGR